MSSRKVTAAMLKQAKLVTPADVFAPVGDKACIPSKVVEIMAARQRAALAAGAQLPLIRILGDVKDAHEAVGGKFKIDSTNVVYGHGPTRSTPMFLVRLPDELLAESKRGRYIVCFVEGHHPGMAPYGGTVPTQKNFPPAVARHPAVKSLPRYEGSGKRRHVVAVGGASSSSRAAPGPSMKQKATKKPMKKLAKKAKKAGPPKAMKTMKRKGGR